MRHRTRALRTAFCLVQCAAVASSLDPSSGSVDTFPVPALPYAIAVDARDRV
jgi:hypothetical protein